LAEDRIRHRSSRGFSRDRFHEQGRDGELVRHPAGRRVPATDAAGAGRSQSTRRCHPLRGHRPGGTEQQTSWSKDHRTGPTCAAGSLVRHRLHWQWPPTRRKLHLASLRACILGRSTDRGLSAPGPGVDHPGRGLRRNAPRGLEPAIRVVDRHLAGALSPGGGHRVLLGAAAAPEARVDDGLQRRGARARQAAEPEGLGDPHAALLRPLVEERIERVHVPPDWICASGPRRQQVSEGALSWPIRGGGVGSSLRPVSSRRHLMLPLSTTGGNRLPTYDAPRSRRPPLSLGPPRDEPEDDNQNASRGQEHESDR